jgi:fatty acid-binding protein DegV
VLRAARLTLKNPGRMAVAARMDSIRSQIGAEFSTDEIRAMREEGRCS